MQTVHVEPTALDNALIDDALAALLGDSVVHVGRGLLRQIASEITPANGIKASRFVIVSDKNVWSVQDGADIEDELTNVQAAPCAKDFSRHQKFHV